MKNNWIVGGALVLAGLLLVIVPAKCAQVILILFGIGAVAEGVYGIIVERKIFDDDLFQKTILYRSIGNIVIGILAVLMPLSIAGLAWKVMTYVLAVYLILSSAAGFFASSKLKNTDVDRKQITIENLFVLAAGVLLIVIGPENIAKLVLRIAGVASLVAGGVYLFLVFRNSRNNIVVVDAEVSDIDDDAIEDTADDSDDD